MFNHRFFTIENDAWTSLKQSKQAPRASSFSSHCHRLINFKIVPINLHLFQLIYLINSFRFIVFTRGWLLFSFNVLFCRLYMCFQSSRSTNDTNKVRFNFVLVRICVCKCNFFLDFLIGFRLIYRVFTFIDWWKIIIPFLFPYFLFFSFCSIFVFHLPSLIVRNLRKSRNNPFISDETGAFLSAERNQLLRKSSLDRLKKLCFVKSFCLTDSPLF